MCYFFSVVEYPHGYMTECYFLFLQEQIKDIIIERQYTHLPRVLRVSARPARPYSTLTMITTGALPHEFRLAAAPRIEASCDER